MRIVAFALTTNAMSPLTITHFATAGVAQEIADQLNLIVGFGYDESQLTKLRPPSRDELGAVSRDVLIYIVHQSGHLGVADSATLAASGIAVESEARRVA